MLEVIIIPNPPILNTTIITGKNSCGKDFIEQYPKPYDFIFPESRSKFETYRHGVQAALVRAAGTTCVDQVLFNNWIQVEFHFSSATKPHNSKRTFIQVRRIVTTIFFI